MENGNWETDWKKALEGGFCFPLIEKRHGSKGDIAPFAAHANDEMRATKMVFLCKRDGIAKSQVLEYATEYLKECGIPDDSLNKHLHDIDKFIGNKLAV